MIKIGVTCKPPNSDVEEFSNLLVQKNKKVTQEKKLLYIMGDMNINLLNSDTNIPTQNFINNMYARYHIPLINKPTRIPEYSATLIDNIYTNNIDSNSIAKQGILTTDLSDHLPIFHIIQTKQVQ